LGLCFIRIFIGYQEEIAENKKTESLDKLPAPQETSNPIVNKGMHELRRVVNAVIKQYGKPDVSINDNEFFHHVMDISYPPLV
jgi:CRISPR/Cas system Type II protein with McrA/HNH and RuvC-like nuclease domain